MSFGVTDRTGRALAQSQAFRAMFPGVRVPEDVDAARRAANAALRGEGHATQAIARYLDEQRRLRLVRHAHLPALFPEMLAHHGIDGDAALALSIMAGTDGVSILQDLASGSPSQVANINLTTRDTTWVTLGGMSSWRPTEMLVPKVPDMVATSIVGMRLRDVASHPVLDAADLTVVAVFDCWDDDRLMEIVTDRHPSPGD